MIPCDCCYDRGILKVCGIQGRITLLSLGEFSRGSDEETDLKENRTSLKGRDRELSHMCL